MTTKRTVLALFALALLPTAAGAQIAIDPEPITCACPKPTWPPHPQDIVNVDSNNSNAIVVPDGGISPAAVYVVPRDKYLVVTNFEIVNSPSISIEGIPLYPLAQATPIQIVEDDAGVITVKRGLHFSGNHDGVAPGPFTGIGSAGPQPNGAHGYRSAGTGLVFNPGTAIRFQIRDPNSIDDTQSNAVVLVNFTMTGYLVDV